MVMIKLQRIVGRESQQVQKTFHNKIDIGIISQIIGKKSKLLAIDRFTVRIRILLIVSILTMFLVKSNQRQRHVHDGGVQQDLGFTAPQSELTPNSETNMAALSHVAISASQPQVGVPYTQPAAAPIISIKKSPMASIPAATPSAHVPTTAIAATARTCPLSSEQSNLRHHFAAPLYFYCSNNVNDFVVAIVDVVKKEGHQADSVSLEVSVLSADFLKLSVASPLEKLLILRLLQDVKSNESSFRVCLIHTLSNASAEGQRSHETNGCYKKIKSQNDSV
ncbi:pseudouridine synthase family protein [Striga asiatica]|uniref:Pseudouridine synthase family protein n=1 Tax=Striga asiatica TaxID=4170 RepID=A0A5A7R8F5_STRAF|nr:pseudouridine synthase family protein [Striga asiatica]